MGDPEAALADCGGEPVLEALAAPDPVPADVAVTIDMVPPAPPPVAIPDIVDVRDLDWIAIRDRVSPPAIRARMRGIVEAFETLLDQPGGPGLLFDSDRDDAEDRAIKVGAVDEAVPLWIVGDLHGDLLALEAALAAMTADGADAKIIFLGDLFDDKGFGLELLLRVFEIILAAPDGVCLVAGNHDEALTYDGNRFASSVSPGDFAEFLNANLAHEWIERAGKLAVRLIARAPRALFMPDGLLVAHAGFPLSDLHARLAETGDWNDPACLSDFAWTRAHPTARRKMPNRFTRGSQFGHEDFAVFCDLSATLERPVSHMVRGHDHVEDRFAIYPAYARHPVLTTVALSRRLPRESFGTFARVPTIAQYVPRSLPQVHRLHIPADIVEAVFPQPPDEPTTDAAPDQP